MFGVQSFLLFGGSLADDFFEVFSSFDVSLNLFRRGPRYGRSHSHAPAIGFLTSKPLP